MEKASRYGCTTDLLQPAAHSVLSEITFSFRKPLPANVCSLWQTSAISHVEIVKCVLGRLTLNVQYGGLRGPLLVKNS